MSRAVPEWEGSSDDAAIPQRVKLRIWERCGGRCSLTGRKIMPGDAYDFEHRIALCNGGEHREFNIVLALRDKHREKTAEDVAIKAKTQRTKAKHLGLWKAKSRGFNSHLRKRFDGTVEPRNPSKNSTSREAK